MQSSLVLYSTKLERVDGGALVCAWGTDIEKNLISAYSLYKDVGDQQFSSNTSQKASIVLKECSEGENDFDCSGSNESFKELVDNIDVFLDQDE